MVGRSRAVLLKYLWICNVLYEVKQEPDHESWYLGSKLLCTEDLPCCRAHCYWRIPSCSLLVYNYQWPQSGCSNAHHRSAFLDPKKTRLILSFRGKLHTANHRRGITPTGIFAEPWCLFQPLGAEWKLWQSRRIEFMPCSRETQPCGEMYRSKVCDHLFEAWSHSPQSDHDLSVSTRVFALSILTY